MVDSPEPLAKLRPNLRGMRSVPKRGSVGSAILTRSLIGTADPTLPRFGTDRMPRRLKAILQEALW